MLKLSRRAFLGHSTIALAASAVPALGDDAAEIPVFVDARESIGELPHVWEECAGSDRAAITLREDWRRDLDRWRSEAGLKRVRFHGIFNDELGVYGSSILSRGKVEANFQNVDRVYDGLLTHGVSPYVELSFMPKALASADRKFGFYAANISPPASLDAWAAFIKSLVQHLMDRYGQKAVRDWPFEVWNEPNLHSFWAGNQQQYFEFYRATSVAIKSIDDTLQVGGPSTAQAQWVADFAKYGEENNLPIDFFSTHAYAGDPQSLLFGDARFPQVQVIPEAMRRVRAQIDASAFRGRPLYLSEWSSDSPAMIGHVIRECLPYCRAMSHWALSATFEELGVANYLLKEGYSGWGALVQGIATPTFNSYRLLHSLGGERLHAEGPAMASRRTDKSIAVAIWNLADVVQPSGLPDQQTVRGVSGEPKRLQLQFVGVKPRSRVAIRVVDQSKGSALPAWRQLGSPPYPTAAQIDLLRAQAELSGPSMERLDERSRLSLDLQPEALALVEVIHG